ncbi:hypothetical protein M3Y99_00657400 [Aphelenchoides fujianensis]|nr:hypothetical protein M3Y99_00657400 [Aphelenchoides fujianensis]
MATMSPQLRMEGRRLLVAAILRGFPTEEPKMFAEDRRQVTSPPLALLRSISCVNTRYRAAVLQFFRSCRLEIKWPKVEGAKDEWDHWRDHQSKFMELENTPLTDRKDHGRIAFHERNGDVVWFPFAALPVLRRLGIVGQHVDELGVHDSLSEEQTDEIIRLFSTVHHLIVPPEADAGGLRLIQHFASSLRNLECSYTITQHADFPDLQLQRYYSTGPTFTLLAAEGKHSLKRIFELPVEEIDLSGSQSGEVRGGECTFHPTVRKLTSAIYGHRGFSWLPRVLPDYYAFLARNAPTLKEFELRFAESSKETWNPNETESTEHDFWLFKGNGRFGPLFHETLATSTEKPFEMRMTRIAFRHFENPRFPCVRLIFSATLKGAELELGVRGEEPHTREHFTFDELPTVNTRFEAACAKFAEYVNNRFGLLKTSAQE